MSQGAPSSLLRPLGWGYHLLMRVRASLYASGLRRRHRLPAPCVSVGNLTFGGTGKTPFTAHLARTLRDMGHRPAILTRGYGRTSRGPLAAHPDASPLDAGDEAVLLARALPDVPVLVGEKREQAAGLAPDSVDVFLLDDGFQHLRVHRDLDLLLIDAGRPGDLKPPPAGRLREPLDACRRADLLVLTKGSLDALPPALALHWSGRPRIAAAFEWGRIVFPDSEHPPEALRGDPVVAFAGTAHPDAFFRQAEAAGLVLKAVHPLEDHARPSPEDVRRVRSDVERTGARAVLCTEKDAVKWLPGWKGPVPLAYPRISVRIEDPSGTLGRSLAALFEEAP